MDEGFFLRGFDFIFLCFIYFSHSEDFFVRKSSVVTLSVKSQRRISVVRDHGKINRHLISFT